MKSVLRTDECFDRLREKVKELGDSIFDLRTLPIEARWDFWLLLENEFPYDKIAEKHSLLVPIRLFAEDEDMTKEEREELFLIKKEYRENKEFDLIVEQFLNHRSIPGHFHLHFIRYKKVDN